MLIPPSEFCVGFLGEASFKKNRLLHLGVRGQVREQKIKEGGEDNGLVCVPYEK